jgi:hypothetical protein
MRPQVLRILRRINVDSDSAVENLRISVTYVTDTASGSLLK